jgi:HlyD family secretion protein
MKRWVILLAIAVVVAAAAAGTWWLLRENPDWRQATASKWESALEALGMRAAGDMEGLVASGFIEAQEVLVATAQGGRIVALHADEGDEVEQGQMLAELDGALLLARIESAQADFRMAEATLALVQAGARQVTLDHALAQVAQAQAAAEAARVSWQDARAIADNPQDLELALLAAEARLAVLGYQSRQAEAAAAAAQAGQDFADAAVRLMEDVDPRTEWVAVGSFSTDSIPAGIPVPPGATEGSYRVGDYKIEIADGVATLYARVHIAVPADKMAAARFEQAAATYRAWTAWTGADQAQVALGGAQEYAELLALQAANPLTLEARANAARAQHEVAAAAVGLAEAQVAGLRMGATPEQIAAAEAQVEMARAALQSLEVQAENLRLAAPISGLVLERPVQPGELALPGAPLFALADLERLSLTLYVPEDRVGRVRLGGEVVVTVDAFPGRTFRGRAIYISSEAEFTPRNVQTREDRVNMVFAVKVELPNPGHLLKPGMPADALLPEAEGGGTARAGEP